MAEAEIIRWRWLCASLDLTSGPTGEVFARLSGAYANPRRAYHNLAHIGFCLETFDRLRGEAADPLTVELAIWFHDAVYAFQADDNEARSADLARDCLTLLGVSPGRMKTVADLIMVTRHDRPPETPDGRVIADVDLAILGAPREEFLDYERNIRREYAVVEDALFREKRLAVLEGFLARPSLFQTSTGKGLFEKAARLNLRQAIGRLRS
ncbi:MAG: N-methyl-D-aspartate receptor NMDAR2C subunit [Candidatus Riflebacteria bacterium]|nr:N-methyl-D-aspartate receptor NMDAR2C subunit [Candidatus Riflebacteria bacterium]